MPVRADVRKSEDPKTPMQTPMLSAIVREPLRRPNRPSARADVRLRCSRAWTRAPQAAARAVDGDPVEAWVSGGVRGSRVSRHRVSYR